jgi:hypothetical protein
MRSTTSRFVTARRTDLAGIVAPAAALPEQHQPSVFGAFGVGRRNRMPLATVRTVNVIAGSERRILSGEIVHSHSLIMRYGPDRLGPYSERRHS